MKPEDKFSPSFSAWEFFVTSQKEYKPDKRGFSQRLWDEFLAHPDKEKIWQNLARLANRLQVLRDLVFMDCAVTIGSGWRSDHLNSLVSIAKDSRHKKGQAADFTVAGWSPKRVQERCSNWSGGLEYAPTWTHLDTDPTLVNGKFRRFVP